jgi:hypothetical protein
MNLWLSPHGIWYFRKVTTLPCGRRKEMMSCSTLCISISTAEATNTAWDGAWELCECAQQSLHGMEFPGMDQSSSLEYFNALSTGIAQATINYLLQHPEQAAACKRASFALTWPLFNQP